MLTNTQDGEAYTVLLHALAPEVCDLSPLKAATPEERAKLLLQQAEKLDVRKYVQAKDIVEGHQNLNLAFVANLFHTRYGDFSLGLFLIVSSSFLLMKRKGLGMVGPLYPEKRAGGRFQVEEREFLKSENLLPREQQQPSRFRE